MALEERTESVIMTQHVTVTSVKLNDGQPGLLFKFLRPDGNGEMTPILYHGDLKLFQNFIDAAVPEALQVVQEIHRCKSCGIRIFGTLVQSGYCTPCTLPQEA